MWITLVWIIALSLGGIHGYRVIHLVAITVGEKDASEQAADIEAIKGILAREAENILNTVFALKHQENGHVLLFLEVRNTFKWSEFIAELKAMGNGVTVMRLTTCSDNVKATFNTDVSYTPVAELQSARELLIYDQLGEIKDMNRAQYMYMLENHFELDQKLQEQGIKTVCYRVGESLPVELIYVATLTPSQKELVDNIIAPDWKVNVEEYQQLYIQ